MAGGTEVVIHAVGMDLTPQNNLVNLECYTQDGDTPIYDGFPSELDRKRLFSHFLHRRELVEL